MLMRTVMGFITDRMGNYLRDESKDGLSLVTIRQIQQCLLRVVEMVPNSLLNPVVYRREDFFELIHLKGLTSRLQTAFLAGHQLLETLWMLALRLSHNSSFSYI
jgi:hypothetical protein